MAIPGLTLITPPSVEPVTLADAKLWLRVDVTDDDTLITDLIQDAREYVEGFTGRQLITATWEASYDFFPPLDPRWRAEDFLRTRLVEVEQTQGGGSGIVRLPRPPLQSITSITYVEAVTGNTLTMSASDYLVDTSTEPGRVTPAYGKVWPVTRWQIGCVKIRFVAGFGSSGTSVPGVMKRAVRLLLAGWYENRESVSEGGRRDKVPAGVDELLRLAGYGEYV